MSDNTTTTTLSSFRYLEERDKNDKITHEGVVSKHSPYASSDNAGSYDAIAYDLRVLKEAIESLSDDADLSAIKTSVESMYNDMKTNPNWGSTAAKEQAAEALKQAQAAATSAALAKEYGDKAESVASAIAGIEKYVSQIDALEKSVADNAQISTNKSKTATDAESAASSSASAAKKSETAAASSATSAGNSASSASLSAASAIVSASNAKTSETNAAGSASSASTSATTATNAATSATSSQNYAAVSALNAASSASAASASQTAAKTSETNAAASQTSAKAWAVSTSSPDGAADTDSTTGKTQSSRTWALYAKTEAEVSQAAAEKAATVLQDSVATVKAAITGSRRIYMRHGDLGFPLVSVKDVATSTVYDATYCRLSATKPTSTTNLWLKPVS